MANTAKLRFLTLSQDSGFNNPGLLVSGSSGVATSNSLGGAQVGDNIVLKGLTTGIPVGSTIEGLEFDNVVGTSDRSIFLRFIIGFSSSPDNLIRVEQVTGSTQQVTIGGPTELFGYTGLTTSLLEQLTIKFLVTANLGIGNLSITGSSVSGGELPSVKVYYTVPPTPTPTITTTPTRTPKGTPTPTVTNTPSNTTSNTPTPTNTPDPTKTPAYYNLIPCCRSDVNEYYRITQSSWVQSPIGTWQIKNDYNIPSGCYTFSPVVPPADPLGSFDFTGDAVGPIFQGCDDDSLCVCPTTTPTPTMTNTPTITPSNPVTPTPTSTPLPPFATPTPSEDPKYRNPYPNRTTQYFTSNNCDATVQDPIIKIFGTKEEGEHLIDKVVTYVDDLGHSFSTIITNRVNSLTDDERSDAKFAQTVHDDCDDAIEFIEYYDGDISNMSFRVNTCQAKPQEALLSMTLSNDNALYPYTHFKVGSTCYSFNMFYKDSGGLVVNEKFSSCSECEFNGTQTPTPTQTSTPTSSPTYTPTSTVTNTIDTTPTVTPTQKTTTYVATNCCNDSIDINVQGPVNPKKIYVFYDGTIRDEKKLKSASKQIREWYSDYLAKNQFQTGNLYETVIGNSQDMANGENWLWWSVYPYLGSLSGGTLSDGSTIYEFDDVVEHSTFVNESCDSSKSGYRCAPYKTQVNDFGSIAQRINRGLDLDDGISSTVSNGVAFSHDNLNETYTSGIGQFDGGEKDYLVITFIEESDGEIGMYHGQSTKEDLIYDPFVLKGYGWDLSQSKEPTNRYIHDYESYLSVWADITNNESGEINTALYSVTDDLHSNFAFVLHNLAAIEGKTISASDFQTKYSESITDVGPQNLNLSILTSENPYSDLETTTNFNDVLNPEQRENGPGLTNFGFFTDPSLTKWDDNIYLTEIGTKVDYFLKDGFIYAGQCYQFLRYEDVTPVVIINESDIVKNICSTDDCVPLLCPSPTATPTNTIQLTPTLTPTITNTPFITRTPTPTSTIPVTPTSSAGKAILPPSSLEFNKCSPGTPGPSTVYVSTNLWETNGQKPSFFYEGSCYEAKNTNVITTNAPTAFPTVWFDRCQDCVNYLDELPTPTPTQTQTLTPQYRWINFVSCCDDQFLVRIQLRGGITPSANQGFLYDFDCYYYDPIWAFYNGPVEIIIGDLVLDNLDDDFCQSSYCSTYDPCPTLTPTSTPTISFTPSPTETTPVNYYKINPKSCCDDSQPFTNGLFINELVPEGSVFIYQGENISLKGTCFTAIYDPNVNPTEYFVTDQFSDKCSGCETLNAFRPCESPTPTPTITITQTPDLCADQDIVILIDQSGSIGSQSNFDFLVNGAIEIANSLEDRMDAGEVQIGAYKWSSCSEDKIELLTGLTSNHTDFVNAISGTSWDLGYTYASKPLELAYNLLSGSTNTDAKKNIILITDGVISDFTEAPECIDLTDPLYSTSQIASSMKLGLYGNGEQVKIYTVNVINGSNNQLESISSGDGYHFYADSFPDFQNVVSGLIVDEVCSERPVVNSVKKYRANPCCGGDPILVGVANPTPNDIGKGFEFNGVCYEIEVIVPGTNAPDHEVFSDDLLDDICLDVNRCSCTNYRKYELENCCDPSDVITIGYSSGQPVLGSGIEYDKKCYQYKGNDGSSDTVLNLDSLVLSICDQEGCLCATPTPTVSPTTTMTPTPSITSSPTVTITPSITSSETPTQTPTNTITTTITASQSPTITPSNTLTVTPTNTTPSEYVIYSLSGVCGEEIKLLFVSSIVEPGDFIQYSGTCYEVLQYSAGTPTDTVDVLPSEIYESAEACTQDKPCVTLTPTPTITQTQTVTINNTPTNTPTHSYTVTPSKATKVAIIQSCCTGGTTYEISVTTDVTIGDSLLYSGSCFNVISLPAGPTTGLIYYDLPYTSCTECTSSETICPTATPTETPAVTSTPTQTPNITPQVTSTPTQSVPIDTWLARGCCDFNDTLRVNVPENPQKVYVFYDGTFINDTQLKTASENIRSWYQGKVLNDELAPDVLYEGIIGKDDNNGENWLWLASYPYLGSLSAGTVNASTISAFGENDESETHSDYNSLWCKSDDNGQCVPRTPSFNLSESGVTTSDIYKRVTYGYQLEGTYGVSDPRSQGIPFTPESGQADTFDTVYGNFAGEEIDYIVIIVTNQSSGEVGLYHGSTSYNDGNAKKSDLVNHPFRLDGQGWQGEITDLDETVGQFFEPTDRFTHDYESYLKIWEEIKKSGGTPNVFVYPVSSDDRKVVPFTQHLIGSIEGEQISSDQFQNKYGSSIYNVSNQNVDLSTLTTKNLYSGFGINSVFLDLNIQYQSGGPGLKNFNVYTDPNILDYSLNSVSNSLNKLIDEVGYQSGYGFIYGGKCYYLDSVSSGVSDYEPTSDDIIENICSYSGCPSCVPSGCYSGLTTGLEYYYYDCCNGTYVTGNSNNVTVCIDTSKPFGGVDVSDYISCTPECLTGFSITKSVTGTCENPGNGIITIQVQDALQPFTILPIGPSYPSFSGSQTFDGIITYSGLSIGAYGFTVTDSINQSETFTLVVDGCVSVQISNSKNTSCGLNNGAITGTTNASQLPLNGKLYKDGGFYEEFQISNGTFVRTELPAGVYILEILDLFNNVLDQSGAITVNDSSNISFDLSGTSIPQCNSTGATMTISNIVGESPFTYSASNGDTGTTTATTFTLTGFSAGSHSITITGNNDCSLYQSILYSGAATVGVTEPDIEIARCLECNGSIEFKISGGTPPFQTKIDQNEYVSYTSTNYDTVYAYTGICSGSHQITIKDSAGCISNPYLFFVENEGGLNGVSISATQPTCGNLGAFLIQIDSEYVANQTLFRFYGQCSNLPEGVPVGVTVFDRVDFFPQFNFENLSPGTWSISAGTINNTTDKEFICEYNTEFVLEDIGDPFPLIITPTGTTCGIPNGVIEVRLYENVEALINGLLAVPFDYYIYNESNQIVYQKINSSDFKITVNNLSSGIYTVKVVDNESCEKQQNVTITASEGMDFTLEGTDTVNGNDGSIKAVITSGQPPFTYQWSSGQVTQNIESIIQGAYTLTIVDTNGCSLQREITLGGSVLFSSSQTVEVCSNEFAISSSSKRSIKEMYDEGFAEVTFGDTGCTLNQATFACIVELSGPVEITEQEIFFYSESLDTYPSDNTWVAAIGVVLNSIEEIQDYNIDLLSNTITINSSCSGDEDPLRGASLSLSLFIEYDVECQFVRDAVPEPSSTPSPTITFTPTMTITPTRTLSPMIKSIFAENCCDQSIIQLRVNSNVIIGDVVNYDSSCYRMIGNNNNNDSPYVDSIIYTSCTECSPSTTQCVTPTVTMTNTVTSTITQSPSITPTNTITNTVSPDVTPTNTVTPSETPTNTPTITTTITSTPDGTPDVTPTDTPSVTPTTTVTPSITASQTQTLTNTPTNTITSTITASQTTTPTTTPTPTGTPGLSSTPTETPTMTMTSTPTDTPVETPSVTPSITNTMTMTPTNTMTNTQTMTYTPTLTQTPTETWPLDTPEPTPSITQTNTPTLAYVGVVLFDRCCTGEINYGTAVVVNIPAGKALLSNSILLSGECKYVGTVSDVDYPGLEYVNPDSSDIYEDCELCKQQNGCPTPTPTKTPPATPPATAPGASPTGTPSVTSTPEITPTNTITNTQTPTQTKQILDPTPFPTPSNTPDVVTDTVIYTVSLIGGTGQASPIDDDGFWPWEVDGFLPNFARVSQEDHQYMVDNNVDLIYEIDGWYLLTNIEFSLSFGNYPAIFVSNIVGEQ
jgi:hypothetical protein